MVKMSDLPRDLTEEVLCRLPVTSLRAARFTCKKWNDLSKDRSFTKKHIAEATKKKNKKEIQVVMMLEYKVSLFSINLRSPSIERIGELISLDVANRVDISQIFHCDGLLLCITKDRSKLVVWNPYCGQTRWIEPLKSYHKLDRYALGYEEKNNKSCRSHKILRFIDNYDGTWRQSRLIREFEIFDLDSNSWKVVDVTPDWDVEYYHRGLSLKGNTYWFAQEKLQVPQGTEVSYIPDFLLCFDFTTERFGPPLPLPSHCFIEDTVTLSSVRDKQLAVLFQRFDSFKMKIWVTTKIEPNAVSWMLFLAVDMKPLTGFQFDINAGSFFIHKRKKVAVVVGKESNRFDSTGPNKAYIIGKKGYFRQMDLGESTDATCDPLVCSYVPSSVQIKQASTQGNHNTL